MKSPVIALLTDFGSRDHYVATLKAVIINICPQARLIDICHEVGPQNINQGSIILREVFEQFPEGTIFLCVVDPGVGSKRRAICVRFGKSYMLGPDNGLLSLAIKKMRSCRIREIANDHLFRKPVSGTFHGRDIFAPVAAHLGSGLAFDKVGPLVKRFETLKMNELSYSRDSLSGEIIYLDQFGNAITNIERSIIAKKKIAQVKVCGKGIREVHRCFSDGSPGKLMALWNSSELLELAVPNGSAQVQYQLKVSDPVKVVFK